MIFDSHAHLDLEYFNNDRGEMYERIKLSGIKYVLNPGVDLESSENAVKLAQEQSWIYAAVGFHPNEVEKINENSFEKLEALAREPKVVAIGEIGLDYHEKYPDKNLQKKYFIEQIHLAESLNLPIVIHDRDAHGDLVKILKEEKVFEKTRVLMHCYSGSAEMAKELLKLGCYFSISGSVTYGNNRKARKVLAEIPLSHMCVETDAPFLAPEPMRSDENLAKGTHFGSSSVRNEPAFIIHTIHKVAELKEIEFEEVAKATCDTARKFFKI